MSTGEQSGHPVVVVGAGPAGIYGARRLAEAGHQVVIINRDLKPGGLAEYGIYFNKHKMKEGIRAQFRKILADPRIHYVGHVRVGERADLTLAQLRELLAPSALIIAAGAQGTKSLGLRGEAATGVHHAKDLVYHFNRLPPFSQREFDFGRRTAIIGIGNVMVDVAHFLVHERKVAEVLAIARRGPAQRAYTDIEIKAVAANIDRDDLRRELERIRLRLAAVGADVEASFNDLTKFAGVAAKEGVSPTKLQFRYLLAPTEILSDDAGRVRALRAEETELVRKGDGLSARGLGTFVELEVDNVVFAVGDRVDAEMGLPPRGSGYATNPNADASNPGDEAYQVLEMPGTFVMGWSRQASDGLVGKAKQDGERGVQVVNRYLAQIAPRAAADVAAAVANLRETLRQRGVYTVDYAAVQRLEEIERGLAKERGLEFFKFAANEEMFERL